jgi:AraC-like DNA-binding protein
VAQLEVHFAQPSLSFSFARAALALPCIGGDAHAHANACRTCESELLAMGAASYTQKVTRALAKTGAGRYPLLDEVSAQCGVSPRTLMRQLRAEGNSFQALLDADRKQRAQWLLQQEHLSVEDIAAQLGYADTSNFSRTVRRWFGVNPRELRQGPPP